jgi:hypothetical protein
MNTTGLLYYSYFTSTPLFYSYLTRAALPSVPPINAGIRHAEKAVPCTVACDITEVTWFFLIVVRPNTYRVT